jgi:hypothetical protein
MEKKSKELKIGLDTQKSFAQMHEDGNMNKGIGGQVMKLDLVVTQEPGEEKRTREPQSPFKIRSKSYDFTRIFIWTIFTQGRTPLDDGFIRQKTSRN